METGDRTGAQVGPGALSAQKSGLPARRLASSRARIAHKDREVFAVGISPIALLATNFMHYSELNEMI